MTKKFFLLIVGLISATIIATSPAYASDTASLQWTDDVVRLQGYHADADGMIFPDTIVFWNASDGIIECDIGGGYNWRFNDHFSVCSEAYLTWRNNKDTSLLLLTSPSFRDQIGDFPFYVTTPMMRYIGDPGDESTILARPRFWIEVSPEIRLGMILKGSISDDGTLTEMHGPFIELPGFPDEGCLLQVGMYNLGGDNPKLEARLICTTD